MATCVQTTLQIPNVCHHPGDDVGVIKSYTAGFIGFSILQTISTVSTASTVSILQKDRFLFPFLFPEFSCDPGLIIFWPWKCWHGRSLENLWWQRNNKRGFQNLNCRTLEWILICALEPSNEVYGCSCPINEAMAEAVYRNSLLNWWKKNVTTLCIK